MLTPHIPQVLKLKLNLTITFQNQNGQSRVRLFRYFRLFRILSLFFSLPGLFSKTRRRDCDHHDAHGRQD